MRLLPPSPLINGVLYEEITSAGDVEPSWPELLPGCKAVFDLVQAPAGSSATASLSGLLEDADLPGAYILQRSAVRMGQVASRDFAIVHWPASGEDVSAPTSPSRVELPAGSTNTGTVTWTHADPPADPVYTLSVVCVTDGTTVTPSGSGLSWSWAVETGKAYVATLTCTSGDFSQPATPLGVVVEDYTALSWTAPAAGTAVAGQTSAVITWTTPTGGQAPYSYSDPGWVYDSQAASTTAVMSTSGAGAGATTVSGLVNGQVVVVQRTVTDAAGTSLPVQGVVSIAAAAATVTPGTAPAGQALVAGSTSVTIGTWGSPSGGTGPYTYALTEISGGGTTISGSGLGAYSATGLVDGRTYAFLLTITDSLSAKGYSVVTVSVSATESLGGWEEVGRVILTDEDVTALSSTDATASTSAWQHTIYEADGTTPKLYVYNNTSDTRTLSISPSGTGLRLVNGGSTQQPVVAVWAPSWEPILNGSRADAWMFEIVFAGEESSGSGAFGHHFNIGASTTTAVSSPNTGARIVNSGSNISMNAASYITSFANQAVQTIAAGAKRTYTGSVQITIADSRRHIIYMNPGSTGFRDPQTGQRVQVQTASTSMTAPGGENTTSASWFASTISGRTKVWMYHDGVDTSGYVEIRAVRLLRKKGGSL